MQLHGTILYPPDILCISTDDSQINNQFVVFGNGFITFNQGDFSTKVAITNSKFTATVPLGKHHCVITLTDIYGSYETDVIISNSTCEILVDVIFSYKHAEYEYTPIYEKLYQYKMLTRNSTVESYINLTTKPSEYIVYNETPYKFVAEISGIGRIDYEIFESDPGRLANIESYYLGIDGDDTNNMLLTAAEMTIAYACGQRCQQEYSGARQGMIVCGAPGNAFNRDYPSAWRTGIFQINNVTKSLNTFYHVNAGDVIRGVMISSYGDGHPGQFTICYLPDKYPFETPQKTYEYISIEHHFNNTITPEYFSRYCGTKCLMNNMLYEYVGVSEKSATVSTFNRKDSICMDYQGYLQQDSNKLESYFTRDIVQPNLLMYNQLQTAMAVVNSLTNQQYIYGKSDKFIETETERSYEFTATSDGIVYLLHVLYDYYGGPAWSAIYENGIEKIRKDGSTVAWSNALSIPMKSGYTYKFVFQSISGYDETTSQPILGPGAGICGFLENKYIEGLK